ncbi:MAG TPA: methyltransferase domain-containing protein [Methylomirabilota bacterium]|nr:methyltransferase domain-containing protein [Methylomirabilota bacterium]
MTAPVLHPPTDLPVEERIRRLLEHLGIDRVHVAGRLPRDWHGLATVYPKMVASLTLMGPGPVDAEVATPLETRLLVFGGDRGPAAEPVRRSMQALRGARFVTLADYSVLGWSDILADRTDQIAAAMLDFLATVSPSDRPARLASAPREGEVAGISYRIVGSGPPLVLLPLWLSPSQWEPIVGRLAERYTTITLGGPELGGVAILESRGRSGAFRRMVRALVDEAGLAPGQTVLEIGSGTGVNARWLARYTRHRSRIVGVDINRYLLREATALAAAEGLAETIEFREGSGESLPFADESFDLAMSVTVIEEVEADRLLAEMVRVTRPGGKVAVISRAMDMPFLMNAPLPDGLKAKLEVPGVIGNVSAHGCADAGLYRRFHAAGLTSVTMFPQLAAFDRSASEFVRFAEDHLVSRMAADEVRQWRSARARAEADGTFFIGFPHHAAVGTKP